MLQKTYIKIAEMFAFTPIISNEKALYGFFGGKLRIKNILTFKEKPQYKCEVSQKNTQKVLDLAKKTRED